MATNVSERDKKVLRELIKWLGTAEDEEWADAKNGKTTAYSGYEAYRRTINHCQDMLAKETNHGNER